MTILFDCRRVYVNEPRSGQKLEIGYFKDETTVGELRNKLRTLLQRGRAKYANGSGFEVDTDMPNARLEFLSSGIFPPGFFPQDDQFLWTTGPLLCGGVVLVNHLFLLSFFFSSQKNRRPPPHTHTFWVAR
jgi:hypothetical protein